MKGLLRLLLLIGWMIVINTFSAQTGSDSAKTSGFIINLLTGLGINLESLLGNFTHFILRKSAHMFVYLILICLFYLFIKDYFNLKYTIIVSFCLSSIYALLDEYHQTFVPLRSGSIKDVLVDMIGMIIGIVLILLIKQFQITFSDKSLKKVKKNTCLT